MKKKILFLFVIQSLLFLVVIAKAFKIQVVDREKLISYSKKQFLRTKKVYPKRGNIYDRNGSPLAINIETYNLVVLPKETKNISRTLKKLHKVSKVFNYKEKLTLAKKRNKYTRLATKINLNQDQIKVIKKIPGIFLESQTKRVYPNKKLFSQSLGFVGYDNDGLAGLEYFLNKKLRGVAVIKKYYRDAKGRPIKFKTVELDESAQNVYASIDKNIQAVSEKYLEEAVKKHNATRGGAAVMDAETGEVLAIANYPSFDPNKFSKYPAYLRKLAFVTDPFEPGSTFKTLTIASALEHNVVRPDTSYFCENGRMKVQNHYITEAESKKDLEWLSVSDILKYSSNVGTAKIAFDLNFSRLQKTLAKLSIGQKTGIEYPGESRGIMTRKDSVSPLKLSNISFGQGIATTGIQMLASYAAIANGGYYVRPTLLRHGNKGVKPKQVLARKTSEELTSMMKSVVSDGTGKNSQVRYFEIAGKTSTAQRVSSSGGYEGYVSGFIGYPVNVNKKFVVSVYIDNPKENGYYGNVAAGPVFQKITSYILLKEKEISYAKNVNVKKSSSVDKIKTSRSSSLKKLSKKFLGMSKLAAVNKAKKENIELITNGFGIVYKEELLKAGKRAKYRVFLRPPSYD